MSKNKVVKHPGYEQLADTPWITQGREIADAGGEGILDNYNKVNVFDEDTLKSIEARNNAVYKRAFDNAEREYTQTMNKYNANNYNQFGSLNSTPSAFVNDNYNRDFQRRLDDLAYNKALNYDTLKDAELTRRYNTLDMFNKMYDRGQIPYELDLKNWQIRNTNRDVAYSNAIADATAGGGWQGAMKGALEGALAGGSKGGWIGAIAGGLAGGAMGAQKKQSNYWTGNTTGQIYGVKPYEGYYNDSDIMNLIMGYANLFGDKEEGLNSQLFNSGYNNNYDTYSYGDSPIMNGLLNMFYGKGSSNIGRGGKI